MSVRLRLTLWYGGVLAGVLLAFAAVLYGTMAAAMRTQVDRSLEDAARTAIRSLEAHRFGPFLLFEDLSADFPELATLDKFFQIFGPSGTITIKSPNLRQHDIPLSRPAIEAAVQGLTTFESARYPGEPPMRLVAVPVRHGDALVNIVQVGTSLEPVEAMLHRLLLILLIAGPLTLAVSLAGGWFLAGRALRPVAAITAAARRIAAGDLTQRLNEPTSCDEIGQLIQTFNQMIAKLDASFRQIRQFSTEASHELRTPLTVLKGEAELALRRNRSAEDYRHVLESALEEIDRMARIVDELLFLSRADVGEVPLESKPVALHTVVDDVRRQAEVLAQEKRIAVLASRLDPCTVTADEWRLHELVLNLVSNAITYSHPDGRVELRLTCEGGLAELTISDQGIGIAPDELPRIFDRFYRTTAARAHAKTGTGLGLAIAKWIAEAHGGAIRVSSMLGHGSTFTVTLPLSSAAAPAV